jgi:hypothetical protein
LERQLCTGVRSSAAIAHREITLITPPAPISPSRGMLFKKILIGVLSVLVATDGAFRGGGVCVVLLLALGFFQPQLAEQIILHYTALFVIVAFAVGAGLGFLLEWVKKLYT